MDWINENWWLVVSLALVGLGVWWLMPSSWPRSRAGGWLLALIGSAMLIASPHLTDGPQEKLVAFEILKGGKPTENVLFWIFSASALLSAVLMITSRNSVYAALWFALVTFSTCGLFLLQSAPFLAAATIIVYAGAIIVTFLFVMMLAQQAGATVYDQRSRQPLLATVVAFVLLGALMFTLQRWNVDLAVAEAEKSRAVVTTNEFSRPADDQPINTMHALGRSLFSDYLFAVELAGTLLLIAVIGAVAVAPRRREGTL